eukprot:5651144-Pleurochrysis_carterae.AAC.2
MCKHQAPANTAVGALRVRPLWRLSKRDVSHPATSRIPDKEVRIMSLRPSVVVSSEQLVYAPDA